MQTPNQTSSTRHITCPCCEASWALDETEVHKEEVRCPKCKWAFSIHSSPQAQARPVSGQTNTIKAPTKRYKDAYAISKVFAILDSLLKIVGVLCLIIAVIAGYVTAAQQHADNAAIFALLGMLAGLIPCILFFILGTCVAAIGQLLRATLDTAVHSSPFLNEEQKAEAMSL
jgi:hypothetical protein